LSFGKTSNTTGRCSRSRPILAQRLQIEKLLHEEEAKLKKYDDDNKKESPGSSATA